MDLPSGTLRFTIQPTSPYAFDLCLEYLRGSPSSVLEDVAADAYARALRVDGKAVLVRVRAGTGLAVEATGPGLTLADQPAIERTVRRVFATDADVTSLLDDVRDDPVFAALAERCRGLRPVLIPNVFEAIVWAIIGQQITVQFAARCKRALVELCGDRLTVDGRDYLVFPEPERLATVTETELAAIQFSRQKIRYVLNVAREVAEGRLILDELWDLPTDEALARLESLVGIGRWTAEYVLMRGLGYPDVIPAADGGLRRIIGLSYGLGRSASEAEVRGFAERWIGWRSYAAFYWWFTLQQQRR